MSVGLRKTLLLVYPQLKILPGRLPYDPDAAVSQSSFAQPKICFMCPSFGLELFMHMKLVKCFAECFQVSVF